jgi:hypothetical protein
MSSFVQFLARLRELLCKRNSSEAKATASIADPSGTPEALRSFEPTRSQERSVADAAGPPKSPPERKPRSPRKVATRRAASSTPRRQSERARVIVGCDYGTHSTKVLYRRRGEDRIRLAQLGVPCAGYPECATPSVIRVKDDRLTFGRQAVAGRGGERFASLKVHLLRGNTAGTADLPKAATILNAVYLAWVFTKVRSIVEKECPSADITFQVATPVDYAGYVGESDIKRRFQAVTQAAWKAAFDPAVRNKLSLRTGVSFEQACDVVQGLLEELLLPESESRCQILPETVAPIVALALDPEMQPGIYLMVDMGAGTTEISVVNSTANAEGEVATCYFDSTIEIGGDKFGRATALKDTATIDRLLYQLERQATVVHHSGFMKVAKNPVARRRWGELTVVLTGGGTRRDDVAGIFRNPRSAHFGAYLKQFGFRSFVLDGPRINLDTSRLGVPAFEARYLVVARGLLVEQPQWPLTFLPHEVTALEADNTPTERRPHWDQ